MPNFSIVAIMRNEIDHVPVMMDSVRDFVRTGGEVVIVDTGSTDGSPELARSLGAKVFEVGDRFIIEVTEEVASEVNGMFVVGGDEPILRKGDRVFDFASARNYAASLASNDFVISMDCDEVATKLDIEEIDRLVGEGCDSMSYRFVYSHNPDGSDGITFTQNKCYDRRSCCWTGIVHEVVGGNAKRPVVAPETTYRLEHYQNPTTDRTSYIKGLALDCFQNRDNDRNSHYLARELMFSGRNESAVREFRRHISFGRWPAERGQSEIYIGDILMMSGDESGAIETWHRAFLTEPSRREALMRLAWHFYRKGEWQKAAAYASASLTIQPKWLYLDRAEHYRNEPHEILYVSLWWLGDKEGSREHWKKALEYSPNNEKYLKDRQFYT